jgi:hypothetical protein
MSENLGVGFKFYCICKQEWTTQRHKQHSAQHNEHDEYKQNGKNNAEKIKRRAIRTIPIKLGWEVDYVLGMDK